VFWLGAHLGGGMDCFPGKIQSYEVRAETVKPPGQESRLRAGFFLFNGMQATGKRARVPEKSQKVTKHDNLCDIYCQSVWRELLEWFE
jgi:hypothetical protein